MARWRPRLGGGTDAPLALDAGFERKDAQTRRASAGRSYVYGGQPYMPPGANVERLVKDGYERVIWAFKAIDAIADKLSGWPIEVIEGFGDDGKVVDDALLPLLNQYSNLIERSAKYFRYRLISQLLLSKKGVFVEAVPTNGGKFAALNLLPPALTSVLPDPDKFIGGFRVEMPGGSKDDAWVDLPVYDAKKKAGVIWIRKPHPTDPYSSVTPLEAAGISLDLDFYARMYNRNFLLNDGRAGQLVAVKGGLSDEDAQELKARFQPGMNGVGRTTVIEADSISVQDTAVTPRDAQYAELRNITKEDLLIALGTPESVIGNASGRTFDNADAEKENWLDVTVLPLGQVVGAGFDALTQGGWEDERRVVHNTDEEPVLQRRKQAAIEQARKDFNEGRITLDEWRDAASMDEVKRPGSRVFWLTGGKVAVGAEADETAAAELKPVGSPPAPPDPGMLGGDPFGGGPVGPDGGGDLSGFDAELNALAADPSQVQALAGKDVGPLEGAEAFALEAKFNAQQPRYPMGTPQGGQFMSLGDIALWLAGKPLSTGVPASQVVDPNVGSTAAAATSQGGGGGAARFLASPDPKVRAAAALITFPPQYPYARVLGAPPAVTTPSASNVKLVSLRKGDVIRYGFAGGTPPANVTPGGPAKVGDWTVVSAARRANGRVELTLVNADGDETSVTGNGSTQASAVARTPHPTVVAQAKRDVTAAAKRAAAAPAGPAAAAAPVPAAAGAVTPPVPVTAAPATVSSVATRPLVGASSPFTHVVSGIYVNPAGDQLIVNVQGGMIQRSTVKQGGQPSTWFAPGLTLNALTGGSSAWTLQSTPGNVAPTPVATITTPGTTVFWLNSGGGIAHGTVLGISATGKVNVSTAGAAGGGNVTKAIDPSRLSISSQNVPPLPPPSVAQAVASPPNPSSQVFAVGDYVYIPNGVRGQVTHVQPVTGVLDVDSVDPLTGRTVNGSFRPGQLRPAPAPTAPPATPPAGVMSSVPFTFSAHYGLAGVAVMNAVGQPPMQRNVAMAQWTNGSVMPGAGAGPPGPGGVPPGAVYADSNGSVLVVAADGSAVLYPMGSGTPQAARVLTPFDARVEFGRSNWRDVTPVSWLNAPIGGGQPAPAAAAGAGGPGGTIGPGQSFPHGPFIANQVAGRVYQHTSGDTLTVFPSGAGAINGPGGRRRITAQQVSQALLQMPPQGRGPSWALLPVGTKVSGAGKPPVLPGGQAPPYAIPGAAGTGGFQAQTVPQVGSVTPLPAYGPGTYGMNAQHSLSGGQAQQNWIVVDSQGNAWSYSSTSPLTQPLTPATLAQHMASPGWTYQSTATVPPAGAAAPSAGAAPSGVPAVPGARGPFSLVVPGQYDASNGRQIIVHTDGTATVTGTGGQTTHYSASWVNTTLGPNGSAATAWTMSNTTQIAAPMNSTPVGNVGVPVVAPMRGAVGPPSTTGLQALPRVGLNETVYMHPQAGKTIYVDNTTGTVTAYNVLGKKVSTSAGAGALAAGYGAWKQVTKFDGALKPIPPFPATTVATWNVQQPGYLPTPGPVAPPAPVPAVGAGSAPQPTWANPPAVPNVPAAVQPPASSPPPPAPPAPVASSHATQMVLAAGVPQVTVGSGWSATGGQKGSNPAAMMTGPGGAKFYVKSQDAKHADNEVAAARLYAAAGAVVPTVARASIASGSFSGQSGNDGIASSIVAGTPDMSSRMKSDPKYRDAVVGDFAIHSWLGNWDAVENDNTITDHATGKPMTVDLGGSLLFRARGGKRTLDPTVTDFASMKGGHNTASATFKGVKETDPAFVAGVERIAAIRPADIGAIVTSSYPSLTPKARLDLTNVLVSRRADLAKRAGVTLPENRAPAAGPAAPTPPPAAAVAVATQQVLGATPPSAVLAYPPGYQWPVVKGAPPATAIKGGGTKDIAVKSLRKGDVIRLINPTRDVSVVSVGRGGIDYVDAQGVVHTMPPSMYPQGTVKAVARTPHPQVVAAARRQQNAPAAAPAAAGPSAATAAASVPVQTTTPAVSAGSAATAAANNYGSASPGGYKPVPGQTYAAPLTGVVLAVHSDGSSTWVNANGTTMPQTSSQTEGLLDAGTGFVPVGPRILTSTYSLPVGRHANPNGDYVDVDADGSGTLFLAQPGAAPVPLNDAGVQQLLSGAGAAPSSFTFQGPSPAQRLSVQTAVAAAATAAPAGPQPAPAGGWVTAGQVLPGAVFQLGTGPNPQTLTIGPRGGGKMTVIGGNPGATRNMSSAAAQSALGKKNTRWQLVTPSPQAQVAASQAAAAPATPAPGQYAPGTMVFIGAQPFTIVGYSPSGNPLISSPGTGGSRAIRASRLSLVPTYDAPAGFGHATPANFAVLASMHYIDPQAAKAYAQAGRGDKVRQPGDAPLNPGEVYASDDGSVLIVAADGTFAQYDDGGDLINVYTPDGKGDVDSLSANGTRSRGQMVNVEAGLISDGGWTRVGSADTTSLTPASAQLAARQAAAAAAAAAPPVPAGGTPIPVWTSQVGRPAAQFTRFLQAGQLFTNTKTGNTMLIDSSLQGNLVLGPRARGGTAGRKTPAMTTRTLAAAGWVGTSGLDIDQPGGQFNAAVRRAQRANKAGKPAPGTPVLGTVAGSPVWPSAATGPTTKVPRSTLARGQTVVVGGKSYIVTETDSGGNVWGYEPGVDNPLNMVEDSTGHWHQGHVVVAVGSGPSVDVITPPGPQATNVPTTGLAGVTNSVSGTTYNVTPAALAYDPAYGATQLTPGVGMTGHGSPFDFVSQTIPSSALQPGNVILLNGREGDGSFVVTRIDNDSKGRPAVYGYAGTEADATGTPPTTDEKLFLVQRGGTPRSTKVQVHGAVAPIPSVPRPSAPTFGGGDIERNEITDPSTAAKVMQVIQAGRGGQSKLSAVTGNSDMMCGHLMELRGYNALPDVVTEDELASYIADGEVELWRGISPDYSLPNADFAEDYRSGPHYTGGQSGTVYGLGSYFAYGKHGSNKNAIVIASQYAGNGVLIHATLKADARIVEFNTIKAAFSRDNSPEAKALKANAGARDTTLGHYAVLLGYDAIRVSGGFGSPKPQAQSNVWDDGFLVVVNRSAMRVSEVTYGKGPRSAHTAPRSSAKVVKDNTVGARAFHHEGGVDYTVNKEP